MTQQQLNNLLKEGNTLKKEALSLLEQETKGNAALAAEFKKSNKQYNDIVSKLKEINGEITEAKKNQSDRISTLMQEEQKLKGLSGIQASFVGLERDRIKLMSKSDSMNSSTRDKLSSIRSLNDELLGLSAEDEVSKAVIEQKIQDIMKGMKGLGADAQAQLDIEKEKFDKAKNLSSLTEKQQGLLNKQMAVYEGMKDTIGGILETASLLSKTVGGVLGGALIGAGYAAEAIGKNVREFGGFLGMATVQTTALGLVFDDAAAVSKTLANEFAGVEGTSFRTQLNTNLMAVNMGISGESAAKLTGILARSANLTAKQAQDLAQQTKDFAKQQGVIPSQAMEDIAQNAELFASYGASATKELAKSAVQAAKLGVSMSTLGKVTDGLLDFESSITKELELSAILGRNINLTRARGLAFQGKIGASVKETIKQLGGQVAFEKMNVIEKRAAAEALGLSVEELSKMAKNMDKLNDDGTMQLSTFETWSQSLSAFASGPLGKSLKGLGGFAIAAGQASPFLKDMGINMGGMVKNSAKVLKNLTMMAASGVSKLFGGAGAKLGGLASSLGTKIKDSPIGQKTGNLFGKLKAGAMKGVGDTPKITDSVTPDAGGKAGGGVSKLTGAMKGIKMTDVVKGAAAMVLIAGSLFILGKALQEFSNVGLKEIGMAIGGMVLLTAAMFGLGLLFSGPQAAVILTAAAGMFLIGAAVAALGFGLNQLASGLQTLTVIGPHLTGLISMVGGIFMLSAAFAALAVSLGLLGVAGIAALPTLLGLGVAGAGLGMLFSAFGGGGDNSSSEVSSVENESLSIISEQITAGLQGVVSAIEKKSFDVYIDGTIVTDLIGKKSESKMSNSAYGASNTG
jgi:hypothetical protein